jgi:hypothetical protein
VVTDYLTLLYQHMMKELERKFSLAILQVTPIQFWFTMLTLWSIRAHNATRDSSEYNKTHRFHLKMNVKDSRYFDAEDDEVLVTTYAPPNPKSVHP